MTAKRCRVALFFAVSMLIVGVLGSISSSAAAQSYETGLYGPFDDGCFYWWDAAQNGYTESHCPQSDDSYDVYTVDAWGAWSYWGDGIWLDDGSFQALGAAGYYGPANGCYYYWDTQQHIEAQCLQSDGAYDLYVADPSGWVFYADAYWYGDGSREYLTTDGTWYSFLADGSIYVVRPDGAIVYIAPNGSMGARLDDGTYGIWDPNGNLLETGNMNTGSAGDVPPIVPESVPEPVQDDVPAGVALANYIDEHPNDAAAAAALAHYNATQQKIMDTVLAPPCNNSYNGCA